MEIRTDLAVERREMRGAGELDGVLCTEYTNGDSRTTVIEITDERGEKALGRSIGKYITVESEGFISDNSLCDGRLDAVEKALEKLVPSDGDILAVGLGNPDITSDALGPLFASMVMATRHITEKTRSELELPPLRKVSVIAPGVAGKTGIEVTEVVRGLVECVKPAAVIAADALAAGSINRLASTVQLCDTGIEPGSGVGNRRTELSERTLGVPVIAIGVPTVVDALSLARDISGKPLKEPKAVRYSSMMVTPKDADIITRSAARLLALAVNRVLQKELSREEILGFM